MPRIFIATNEEQIRFGNKEYVFAQEAITRYCIEEVSQEMFDALMNVASLEKHKTAVSYILYNILDARGLSNN